MRQRASKHAVALGRGSPLRSCAAFNLVEVMIAMALGVIALTTFYASAGQAIRILRAGKEIALASQLLQQRVESFRSASLWKGVTTPDGISTLVGGATQTAANFRAATETFTVTSYPEGGTPIVVTRSPTGALTRSGASLTDKSCVKLTAQVSWTGIGRIARTRQISTIITKGGL